MPKVKNVENDDISCFTEPSLTANWKDCPVCYQQYDYAPNANDPNLIPRLLVCGHLVCSLCASELWHDAELTCPSCFKNSNCQRIEQLPVPVLSPVCSPISHSSQPSDTISTLSEGRQNTGSDTEFVTPPSSPGSSPNLLKDFISKNSKPKQNEFNDKSKFGPFEEGSVVPTYLICIVRGCRRKRLSGRYVCEMHRDKAQRVTWRSTETLMKRYNDVKMSAGFVDQAGRITGEMTPEPNIEHFSPEKLATLFRSQCTLSMGEALWLIDQASDLLVNEPNVLTLEAPIKVVGDLHGQFFDLLSMLDMCGLPDNNDDSSPSYLFLGDYVDRGAYSCEVMLFLLAMKLNYPTKFHLLRGNHECRSLTTHFGFKDECKNKYGLPVYIRFLKLFQMLPICALVTNSHGQYMCAHGGLSPDLHSLEEVNKLSRRDEPPMSGPLCDILWADPADDPGYCNTSHNMTSSELEMLLKGYFMPNHLRGCSVSFGYAAALEFLEANNLLCLIRAHAVQEDGCYRHFEDIVRRMQETDDPALRSIPDSIKKYCKPRDLPAVITVFSAPNYCGRYGNRGAILTIEWEKLEPTVRKYNCVEAPTPRTELPSRANVHITALIEACPYMPSTFRDFVMIAGRMGPAQPLEGLKTSAAAQAAHEVCSAHKDGDTVAQATAKFEARVALGAQRRAESFAAAVGASFNSDEGPSPKHVKYQAVSANDRINERHPEALYTSSEKIDVHSSNNITPSISYPKVSVRDLMKRFEPKRQQSDVEESRKEFERREHRRKSTLIMNRAEMYQAVASGKSAPTTPVPSAFNNKAFQNSSSKQSKFPTSWSSKLVAPWRISPRSPKSNAEDSFEPGTTSSAKPKMTVRIQSPIRSRKNSEEEVFKQRSYTASEAHHVNNKAADCWAQSNLSAKKTRQRMISSNFFPSSMSAAVYTHFGSIGANFKQQRNNSQANKGVGKDLNAGHSRRFSEGFNDLRIEREPMRQRKMSLPATHRRRSEDLEEFTFTQAEMLGLKLLFALMDIADTQYIDVKALELYAGEHDDFAQTKEVEACIEAVDVDNDGKIGLMDFLSFASRLKLFYEENPVETPMSSREDRNRNIPTFMRTFDGKMPANPTNSS